VKFPIIYSPEFLEHDPGQGHPESADRLRSIVTALESASFSPALEWHLPTPISASAKTMASIARIHDRDYIDLLRHMAARGGGVLDSDTVVSARSYDVAVLAVSGWLDGIDRVLATNAPAFVLARPPGHHAESKIGMGFCLFSNAAIAAHYALEQPHINKVAILDWDVHHGNGTEEIVHTNPHIRYCSLHQSPCYPGTGMETERGMYGNVLNIPIPPGTDRLIYRQLFTEKAIPFISEFNPDLIIISAGYDAHSDDPLANLTLIDLDYRDFVKILLHIQGKILLGLEGGYNLNALARSVVATIDGCIAYQSVK
jgi:acetoin utilization deacetylase AcuC-like enzyme